MTKYRVIGVSDDMTTAKSMLKDAKRGGWTYYLEEYIQPINEGRWVRID